MNCECCLCGRHVRGDRYLVAILQFYRINCYLYIIASDHMSADIVFTVGIGLVLIVLAFVYKYLGSGYTSKVKVQAEAPKKRVLTVAGPYSRFGLKRQPN